MRQVQVAAHLKEGISAHNFKSDEPYQFVITWCWYLSALMPAYMAAWYIMRLADKVIEHQFFTSRQVLYFAIGIRVGLPTQSYV